MCCFYLYFFFYCHRLKFTQKKTHMQPELKILSSFLQNRQLPVCLWLLLVCIYSSHHATSHVQCHSIRMQFSLQPHNVRLRCHFQFHMFLKILRFFSIRCVSISIFLWTLLFLLFPHFLFLLGISGRCSKFIHSRTASLNRNIHFQQEISRSEPPSIIPDLLISHWKNVCELHICLEKCILYDFVYAHVYKDFIGCVCVIVLYTICASQRAVSYYIYLCL